MSPTLAKLVREIAAELAGRSDFLRAGRARRGAGCRHADPSRGRADFAVLGSSGNRDPAGSRDCGSGVSHTGHRALAARQGLGPLQSA